MLRLIDEPTSAALAVYGLDRPHMPLSSSKSSAAVSGQEQPQAASQVGSFGCCSAKGLASTTSVCKAVQGGRLTSRWTITFHDAQLTVICVLGPQHGRGLSWAHALLEAIWEGSARRVTIHIRPTWHCRRVDGS